MLGMTVWIACIAAVGWSALSLICRNNSFRLAEKIALSYGLGLGFISIEMPILSFFSINFSIFSIMIWWVPIVIWALLITPLRRKHRGSADPAGQKIPLSLPEKIFVFGISFETIYAFFRALIKPMESYDAIAIYALKSKIFYLARAIPNDFFNAFKNFVPHIEYPLLVPLAETSFYTFANSLNDLLVKIIFPFYYISLLAIFYSVSRHFFKRSQALLFTFFLATIPQLTDFATNGYADLPFAFYCSASFFYLYLWMRRKESRILALSFILSAFAIWTKAEGLMFAGINTAVVVVYMLKERLFYIKGAIYAGMSFLLIAVYLLMGQALGIAVNTDFIVPQSSVMAKLVTAIQRIPLILYEYQIQFFGPKKWNLIWALFIISFIIGFKKIFNKNLMPVTAAIIMALLGYSAVYMLSSAPQGIGWHLSTSCSRLFLHFLPIVVLWLAIIFDQYKLEV